MSAAHTYEVEFTTEGRKTIESLEKREQDRAQQKLTAIGSNEFRNPWDWDYKPVPAGRCDGRFRLSDKLRAHAEIDRQEYVIRVHRVERRENLY